MNDMGPDELRDVQDSRASLKNEREARLRRRRYSRPNVDIYSTDTEMVVLADMPGVTKDDLEVALEEDDLIIEGPVRGRSEQESALPWGYYRRFKLRTPFDRSRIRAGIRGGVLRINLPKAMNQQKEKVPVD
ncbi:MAG: Hsp20/alpha crystallin family protein [Gemmatimonadales bacterium]|jgi:HSP20 family protein